MIDQTCTTASGQLLSLRWVAVVGHIGYSHLPTDSVAKNKGCFETILFGWWMAGRLAVWMDGWMVGWMAGWADPPDIAITKSLSRKGAGSDK